ncbi:hypothetical protein Shyhy01_16300 [Streptomyces hygroscopicus subsp. hygroscopicus]|nr:hypothetical protein Shyhy01_16300 [Streptomyces hygroscopicus subsp. hygroscopicus]
MWWIRHRRAHRGRNRAEAWSRGVPGAVRDGGRPGGNGRRPDDGAPVCRKRLRSDIAKRATPEIREKKRRPVIPPPRPVLFTDTVHGSAIPDFLGFPVSAARRVR